MTESEIERRVERMTDHLDRMLISGAMTSKNYNQAMRELSAWANLAHAKRVKRTFTNLWNKRES
jgi:hypothetical protein